MAFIVSACRTPIGAFLGQFSELSAVDLGVHAVKAALERAKVEPALVEDVIFGNARQAGGGPNPARQILIKAGLPQTAIGVTLNKACGSGLEAIVQAARVIDCGEADVVVAGGTESMTRVPFELDLRQGFRLGHATVHDGNFRDGFFCPIADQLMGRTAETLAEQYKISREEQDLYAAASQRKCELARKAGRFKREIAPVTIVDKKGAAKVFDTDEHPRDGVTAEQMAKLPAVFKKDGTVHAGNSSGVTDGAAALVLVSEKKLAELKLKPLARVQAWASGGVDPKVMGLGPVPATKNLFKKMGGRVELYDFDVIELNEAFAAQVIACNREMNLPMDRVNPNGGSIVLGHPIGATGARIVVTMLHEMERLESPRGLASLCISGGMGMSVAFERA